MKLATIHLDARKTLVVFRPEGCLPLASINRHFQTHWPENLFQLIEFGEVEKLAGWLEERSSPSLTHALQKLLIPHAGIRFAPPYRRPRKIWGIGLNYRDHAADLGEKPPAGEPASFMKPDTTIVGHGDPVVLPRLSQRTTGEGELAVIIGRECRDLSPAESGSVIAGYTAAIDLTAEDILRRNPRNLTQAKSFDTFFSFGPLFLTPDEIEDLESLTVETVHNGETRRSGQIGQMMFSPAYLVSYHSRIMTLLPGDIISTGTPGAVVLGHGDTVGCRITGFHPLENPVIDRKVEGPS